MAYIDTNPGALLSTPRRRSQYASRTLGTVSIDSIAQQLNTSPSSFLLLAGGGILAGFLLNDLSRSVGKTIRSVKRGAKRKAQAIRQSPVMMIAGVGILGVAGYFIYQQMQKRGGGQGGQA